MTTLSQTLRFVHLPKGTVLYEAGDPIHSIYFPHNAVVGLINTWMASRRGHVLRARGLMRPVSALKSRHAFGRSSAGPRHCIKDRLEQDP